MDVNQYKESLDGLIEYAAKILTFTQADDAQTRALGRFLYKNYPKYLLDASTPDETEPPGGMERLRRLTGMGEELSHDPDKIELAEANLTYDPDKVEDDPKEIGVLINKIYAGSGIELSDEQKEKINQLGGDDLADIRGIGSSSPTRPTRRASETQWTLNDYSPETFEKSIINLSNFFKQQVKTDADIEKYLNTTPAFEFPSDAAALLSSTEKEGIEDLFKKFSFKDGIVQAYKFKLLRAMDIPIDALTEVRAIIINLNDLKGPQSLNEGFLSMFGGWAKYILKAMFGDLDIPVKITGKHSEVHALARALAGEKNYIDAASKYGLTDKQTYASKTKLDRAVIDFERETGIKWPFGA